MVFNDLSNRFNEDLNLNCGNAVDMILKMSMIRKSYPNVSCLIHHNEIKELFNKINNKKFKLEI
jgi:hypothetical protein